MNGTIYSVTSLTLSDFDMVLHEGTKTKTSDTNLLPPDTAVRVKSGAVNNCSLKYAASDVFCYSNSPKSKPANQANVTTGEASANTILPDNAGAANAFSPINIDSLQDERTRESIQKYNESFMIPLNPDKNINMKLNQQQVQINIKY